MTQYHVTAAEDITAGGRLVVTSVLNGGRARLHTAGELQPPNALANCAFKAGEWAVFDDAKGELAKVPLGIEPSTGPAQGWATDAIAFAQAVAEFEHALPGFWWSVGQCSVGAHASCAVDGQGCQASLLDGVAAGEPFDEGFHCDTRGGSPAEALRAVMQQALAYMETKKPPALGAEGSL